MTFVYLDTNYVSSLVRDDDSRAVNEIRNRLVSGEINLGLSFAHLIELSDPNFASRNKVGELLDACDVRWASSLPDLFDQEIRAAFVRALLGKGPDVQAFFTSFRSAYDIPQNIDVPPSPNILEIVDGLTELHNSVDQTIRHASKLDELLKEDAAVYENPTEPLEAMIRDRGIGLTRTPGGLRLPAVYPPRKIIEKAGGLEGFPAYCVWHHLHRDRLGDKHFPVEPNDIIDEIHACYLPYVPVTSHMLTH